MAARKMELWWSPLSPYVRIVLVAAHELGVADGFERHEVTPETIIDAVAPDNPLALIPTLVVGGEAIYDSRSIVEWLDARFGPKLIPADPDARARVMTGYALGSGLTDAANFRRNLSLQPEGQRPDGMIARLAARMERALDALEAAAGEGDDAFTADRIAAAVALGYLDFRYAEEDWRDGRPALAAWHKTVSARPSLAETRPST